MVGKNENLILYFLITSLIPLACVAISVYVLIDKNYVLSLLLFALQSSAPSLAAIILVVNTHSLDGLKAFISEKYISNISIKLCVFSFVTPAIILIISKIATVTYLGEEFRIILPNAKESSIILWALIAEELGWRGFLQERIERRISVLFTPLVVGVLWGLWHFHYYLSGSIKAPFALLILGCVFESYGYFVFTKLARGNIVPASLWHFSGNLFIKVLGFNTIDASDIVYTVMTFTYSLCVLVFMFYYGFQVRRNK